MSANVPLKVRSYAAGVVTVLVGALVLAGWQFDLAILKTFLTNGKAMAAHTAATFVIAGLALVLLQRSHPIANRLVQFLAQVIMLVGVLSLCENFFGLKSSFDEILFREPAGTVGRSHPSLMAPNTALSFLLLGTSFFLLTFQRFRGSFLIEFPLIFSLTISVIGLVGYFAALPELTGAGAYTQIAANTAATFIILCIGMLFTAYEQQRVPITIEQKLFAGFTAAGAVIIFITFLSVSGIQSLLQAGDLVERTQQVKNQLHLVLSHVLDVQSGDRGFLLAGDDKYLVSHKKASRELPIVMNNLQQQIADNPHQQQTLVLVARLVEERVAFSNQVIFIRKKRGEAPARSLFETGRGKSSTDSVRVFIAEMIAEEDRLLQTRIEAETDRARQTELIIYLSLGVQVLLLAFIFVVVNRDVTGRKQAENQLQRLNEELEDRVKARTGELRLSENKYRDLADSALVGIYRSNLKGEILYVNQALTRIMGFDSPEELMRSGAVTRWRDPQERQVFLDRLQRDGKVEASENVVLTASGQPIDILVSARIQGDELTGTVLDITERKRADEAIKKSEERYRSTLDNMLEGCQIIGFDWRYIYINAAAEKQNRRPKEELLGNRYMDMWPGIEATELFRQTKRCMEERITHQMEVEFFFDDGRKGWYDVIFQPSPEGVFILSQEITERKRIEQERLARETAERANQAKSEFLSRMSHELRTPLNSVLGFAQLLELDAQTPDQMQNVRHILKSGRHLLDLINEVLDIARIESGRMAISPETVHLDDALFPSVDLVRPLADKRGIGINVKIPSSKDIFITADLQRLKQVLLNLLSNAVKYNREKGEIRVTASLLTDGYLHLTVADTGEGIPAEKMNRLFTPFDRLELAPDKIEGTGLGLALSKGLVEAMGGRIGAQSVAGKGSTFWFDLPLTTQQKETIVMAEVDDYLKSARELRKALVLYVEDNLANIQLVEKIIGRLPGVEMISAMQGRLTMDLARQHKLALILLDLHLPDVPGMEVLKQLRVQPETKDIPIVVMSADATRGQIDRALAAGAQNYLTKPIDVKEFLRMIGEILAT